MSKENEQFKEKLEELISDPAVKSNSALSELLSGAVKKCEKTNLFVPSLLAWTYKSEVTLPKMNCQRALRLCNLT